jgi:hypothetical protein
MRQVHSTWDLAVQTHDLAAPWLIGVIGADAPRRTG